MSAKPISASIVTTKISLLSKSVSLDDDSQDNTEKMLLPPAATAETTIEADNALQPAYTVA